MSQKEQTTAIAKQESQPPSIPIELNPQTASAFSKISAGAIMMSPQIMENIKYMAATMASSEIALPARFHGKVGDCMAIVMQSMQWGMNPFVVAQKTHLVSGNIGYEAQLVNAVVQESGAVAGRFHYEYRGEGLNLECRVGAILRGETEIQWGEWLKRSDITTTNSPLWKTNPKQQMGYLQVKNWARQYCPSAMLGVYTTDELEGLSPTPGTENQYYGAIAPKSTDIPTTASPIKTVKAEVAEPEKPTEQTAVIEKKPDEVPAQQESRPIQRTHVNKAEYESLKAAFREGGASSEKFQSGLSVFFGITKPSEIKIAQLEELKAWAKAGCNEPKKKEDTKSEESEFGFDPLTQMESV